MDALSAVEGAGHPSQFGAVTDTVTSVLASRSSGDTTQAVAAWDGESESGTETETEYAGSTVGDAGEYRVWRTRVIYLEEELYASTTEADVRHVVQSAVKKAAMVAPSVAKDIPFSLCGSSRSVGEAADSRVVAVLVYVAEDCVLDAVHAACTEGLEGLRAPRSTHLGYFFACGTCRPGRPESEHDLLLRASERMAEAWPDDVAVLGPDGGNQDVARFGDRDEVIAGVQGYARGGVAHQRTGACACMFCVPSGNV